MKSATWEHTPLKDVLLNQLHYTELFYTGATVVLQTPTDISTPEGNDGETMTVNLCIRLTNIMGGLQRNVVLNLTTVEVTAGA